jgi:formate-dependent nitrite reductase membrane component NrfD
VIEPALFAQLAVNPQSGVALPPHWGWYVVLYFFLGGLAAGSYFIAMMLDLAGDVRDRDIVRAGYLAAFPLVVICGLLLIIDLGVPLRFWHMLMYSKRPPLPLIKPWSPISVGSWGLTAFGFFSFVSFIGVLIETGRVRQPMLARVDQWARERPRPLAVLWGVVGAFFGFFLAGYTGVLVSGTSVAVWHNARVLGGLFLASAASTSYALLLLIALRRGRAYRDSTVAKLERADRWAIGIEMLLLVTMLVMLGALARPFITGGYGVLFWIGVVVIGLLAPLVLHRYRPRDWDDERRAVVSAACVLVGGLLLRFVIVMAPQWPLVPPWYL